MHLHPARISPHILFVPLNYWPAMTDLYRSPDTQWLSLGSLGFLPPFTHPIIPPIYSFISIFSPVPSANPPPWDPWGIVSNGSFWWASLLSAWLMWLWCATMCSFKRSNSTGQWPVTVDWKVLGFARTRPCVITVWCGYWSSGMFAFNFFISNN